MRPERTEALVVGAGPTGLALAIALRQAGAAALVVDRLPAQRNTSRAAVIHAHTLEALEGIGVAERLADEGLRLARFAVRERDRRLLGLRFDTLPSRYPYLLMLPQDATEAALEARLAALGGAVLRETEAVAAAREGDGAQVTLARAGATWEVRARYVVAADGMRSLIREAAGIAFEGAPYAQSFVLADVRMDWPLGAAEVALFVSAQGMMVVAPLPGGAFRIVASVDDAPEAAGAAPGASLVAAILAARGPTGAGRVAEVLWSTRFRIHHRLAAAYRAGPFLLAGDAAHVHSPAGGQGMNVGLVDAVTLGRMLPEVLAGRKPDDWLDGYGALRRPAAAQVLALADRLTALATARGLAARAARNAVFATVAALPPARRRLERDLSGLSRRRLARLAA